jgi:hypothetical protein
VQRLKLIFVHTPKSGGTSIRTAITEFFSSDLVLADYGDRPNDPISPMNIDPYGFLDRCRQQNPLTLADKAAAALPPWASLSTSLRRCGNLPAPARVGPSRATGDDF